MHFWKRWQLGLVALVAALGLGLVTGGTAAAVETGWSNWDPGETTADSPSEAVSTRTGSTCMVWRGSGNDHHIYYVIYTAGTEPGPGGVMSDTYTDSAPTVVAIGGQFVVFHRTAQNTIAYSQNIGDFWTEWYTVPGSQTQTTPVAAEINGQVALAWTGLDGVPRSRMGALRGSFSPIDWFSSQQAPIMTQNAPAIINFAGTLVMFVRNSNQRVAWAWHDGQLDSWGQFSQVPNSPATNGRPTAAAVGNTIDVAALSRDESPGGGYTINRWVWNAATAGAGQWSQDPQSWRSRSVPTLMAIGAVAVWMFLRGLDNAIYQKNFQSF
ncbi:hypothetical protein ACWDQO_31820 [Streptomyces sp. NPDC003703]|uniref:hypothetical protein n=1 Tax=Streptomyces sp. NPDC003283 TaxID=3364681 RepID=UPI0036C6148D